MRLRPNGHGRKITSIPSIFFISLFLLLPSFLSAEGAREYVHAQTRAIPLSPDVLHGRLPNGLTYYIRKNSVPDKHASLRLVVNAGSVLESDDQRGLAHFLEHMAFNGTEKFAKNEVVKFLESLGMEFGPDTNAYTTFDETVYKLEASTDKPGTVETSLDILSQWAGHMTLDSTEIDKERGVILEEWRQGRGAASRMRDKQFPILFRGSRYAERLPIGDPAIIRNFKYEALRRFYHDWYRPDLMAVIAVGDVDPASVQRLIERYFAPLENPPNERVRTLLPVPDHHAVRYAPVSDPEATYDTVSIYNLAPPDRLVSEEDYRNMLKVRLFELMANMRLDEESQKSDSPFLYAGASSGNIVRTKSARTLAAVVKPGKIEAGLTALALEARRMSQLGFTQTEFELARSQLMQGILQAYNERRKTDSERIAQEYIRNFLTGEASPGIGYEYELYQKLVPGIGLPEVNALAKAYLEEGDRVVLVNAVAKDGTSLPTEAELASAIASADSIPLVQVKEGNFDRPLMAKEPTPGSIVREETLTDTGIVHWTLSNGAQVYLKPTQFKDDQILFSAYSRGGTSRVQDKDFVTATQAASIASESGLGDWSRVDLERKLAGRNVSVSPYIGTLTEGLTGNSSTEDTPLLFQLISMTFMEPRFDRGAYNTYIQRLTAKVENQNRQPDFQFTERVQQLLTDNNFRARALNVERIGAINFDSAQRIYRERFADPGNFTYFFVGNIDPVKFRPLVTRYIAGMPSVKRTESFRDPGIRYSTTVKKDTVTAGSEPKSRIAIIFTGKRRWEREQNYLLRAMSEILTMRLLEVIREDKSGAYSIGASAGWEPYLDNQYVVEISFGADPARAQELTAQVFGILSDFKRNLIDPSYIERAQATERSAYETSMQENNFWLQNLQNLNLHERPFTDLLTYPRLLATLTPEAVRDAANSFLNSDSYVQVILYPAEAGKE